MKLRYVRAEDMLDDRDQVLVRGGDLESDLIRVDAERMFRIYGVYGISVFALRDIHPRRARPTASARALRRVGALS